MSWIHINEEIRKCKRSANPIECLLKLFERTNDGMVAYELGESYEDMGDIDNAIKYYKLAYNLFPLPKYKNMAKMAIKRLKGGEAINYTQLDAPRNYYWAEIRLPEKIVIYTPDELRKRGLLDRLEYMRKHYRLYQRPVSLDYSVIFKLEESGVKVISKDFLALEGVWHWFTGHWNKDAFRLSPELKKDVQRKGFVEINLMYRSPAEFTPTLTTPKTFPQELAENYVEVEFIGKGGFARVFKAKRKDGKVVAVKIPISLDPATGKSFLRELMNWTKLEHKNIVKVYDCNILPIPYFEMEMCDKSLADIPKPMDVEEASWIIFNIAEGLKYAHKRKIIHCDFKPQNIMLKDGIPKISDWGLSKVMAESTSTSMTAFTPHYAAPEQISKKFGDKKDPHVDLWQLEVIFYELVTGELPFKGEDPTEILSNVTMIDPIPPSQLNPKGVENVIMRCLQKEQSKRYNSVGELQRDLSKILNVSYQTSLKTSVSERNFRRSAYYCSELLLINLKVGDLFSAYKFAKDLMNYASEELKPSIVKICDELEFWLKREFSEDDIQHLIKMADIIVHKLRVGFKR